uniref:Mitochondrial pyruvate carrier n=1 Tax=Strigamia maritima TaxID=126957 RepID=T1IY33_STRMM
MSAIYRTTISILDKFVPRQMQPFWNHPAGPKTIFFWAPAFKWGLVAAGIQDIARPVEKLSLPQCISLFFTGVIWSRYSMAIIPKNYNLFSVNVFIAATQTYHLSRIFAYRMGNKTEE